MIDKIADWLRIPNVENPLIENTISNRIDLLQCKRFGCLTYGSYYILPQAHCRRCGASTCYAREGISEWIIPWG